MSSKSGCGRRECPPDENKKISHEEMYNSRLIRRIQEKKFSNLTRDLIQINCLAVSNLNHYTRMFSVLLSGCN